MSRDLLLALNGRNRGAFRRWLENFPGEPRIAWYPSAGEDFRDLLYLHPGFSGISPASRPEPPPPDLFLHTDYFPWSSSKFLDTPIIYSDPRTKVSVKLIEELPVCPLPVDSGIVDFPEGSIATGRVIFLEVEVQCRKLGTFMAPVVYVFVENAAFCACRALPLQASFSHIIHVRFGYSLGGGRSSGKWILNVLKRLRCEVFVSDGRYNAGDHRVYELYPALRRQGEACRLAMIRVIPASGWSNFGDVSWNLVESTTWPDRPGRWPNDPTGLR